MGLQSFLGAFELLDASVQRVVDGVVLSPHLVGARSDAGVDGAAQFR